jgi:hypothetical protein
VYVDSFRGVGSANPSNPHNPPDQAQDATRWASVFPRYKAQRTLAPASSTVLITTEFARGIVAQRKLAQLRSIAVEIPAAVFCSHRGAHL